MQFTPFYYVFIGEFFSFSDFEKAALFNRFFESVYHKQSDLTSSDNVHFDTTNTLSEIIYHDVYLALAELDPHKAMGVDAIGPVVLEYTGLWPYIFQSIIFSNYVCLLQVILLNVKYITLCLL